VLALALLAGPALAYTIYLKDGSHIIAKEKYEIRGDLAIITLPSGTQSSMPASEIDVARTERANQSRLGGTALVIEGGETTELKDTAPPPPKPNLQDYIRRQEGELRGLDERQIAEPAADAPVTPGSLLRARETARRTRTPYSNSALAAEILETLAARGIGAVKVHNGANARKPLLVFETETEGSVFKAIVSSSGTLRLLATKHPGAIDGFEIVCETAGGRSGGRFDLTNQLAEEIVSRRYEITRFYLENVQF